ncbi:acyltransferase family protein [Pseudactinotalea sp.]|uniref:acyltransferase family protein n=1 Tax=Pseudactinotalea sp. TaxID=1926260 RepID=UPI003B3B92EC
MTTRTVPTVRRPTRLHGLDTLRAVALGLGIVLHSLMPFIPGLPWLITDPQSTDVATATSYWIHLFRMVLFMLLAGFFGRMIVERRGARSYAKDRALRIGLPVVVFWPVAVFSLGGLAAIGASLRGVEPLSPVPPVSPGIAEVLMLASPGQLWFLVVLVQCVFIALAVRALARRALGEARSGQVARRIGTLLAAPGGIVLAALPYLAGLLLQQTVVGGIHPPPTILPMPSALTAYLGAFAVGWFLHAAPGALDRIAGHWPVQLAVGAVLAVVGFRIEDTGAPLMIQAALIAFAGWAWTLGLIGVCMRYLTRENRVMRYLADASYWSYLLHLPILVALGIALADLAWPIPVKLAITWAITAAVLLLSYDLLVRSTWIGTWLNGRRMPRALGSSRG